MRIDDFLILAKARPFVPFNIHTTAGERIPVPTLDHLHILPRVATVIIDADSGPYHILTPDHVSSITVDAPQVVLPGGAEP